MRIGKQLVVHDELAHQPCTHRGHSVGTWGLQPGTYRGAASSRWGCSLQCRTGEEVRRARGVGGAKREVVEIAELTQGQRGQGTEVGGTEQLAIGKHLDVARELDAPSHDGKVGVLSGGVAGHRRAAHAIGVRPREAHPRARRAQGEAVPEVATLPEDGLPRARAVDAPARAHVRSVWRPGLHPRMHGVAASGVWGRSVCGMWGCSPGSSRRRTCCPARRWSRTRRAPTEAPPPAAAPPRTPCRPSCSGCCARPRRPAGKSAPSHPVRGARSRRQSAPPRARSRPRAARA